ncbi:MAG: FHA domain-containing protein [Ruminococcus sp.]|nr:FHA domain-containing protein [Ruminococcus sp.]
MASSDVFETDFDVIDSDSDSDSVNVIGNTDSESDDDDDSELNIPLIIAIFGGIAVILIILIIVLVVKGKKKIEPTSAAIPAPIPSPYQNPAMQQQIPAPQPQPVAQPVMMQPISLDSGAGETSLLNAGARETTVLGGAGGARAVLVCRKNGTNISINRPEFIIGKERSRVNYCVNNNAVSRQHAKITSNGGVFFITDLGSSNYTYVNGTQISPNEPTRISNGDVIKLADEEFEFRG